MSSFDDYVERAHAVAATTPRNGKRDEILAKIDEAEVLFDTGDYHNIHEAFRIVRSIK